MAEQEQKIDPKYINGFEHGYWLQKGNNKDIDAILESSKGNEAYYNGLKTGQKEAQREQFRQRMNDLDNERGKGNEFDIS